MSIVGPTQSWNVTCVVIKKSKTGMEQQKAAQKAMGEVIWANFFSKTQVKMSAFWHLHTYWKFCNSTRGCCCLRPLVTEKRFYIYSNRKMVVAIHDAELLKNHLGQ
jgi:hypothetical protein